MARVNATGKESGSNFSPANGTGLAVRTAMKDIFESLRTLNSAAGDPSGTANLAAYQLHINTSDNLLKIRNGANSAFITVGDVTETNLGLLPRTGGSSAPMTGQFLAHNSGSSESTPDISFAVDTDTGLFRSAANTLAISCAGSRRFTFNTTTFESRSDISIQKTDSTDAFLQINTNTNTNNAYLDFKADTSTVGSDFGLRLIRGAGETGDSILMHRSGSTNNGSLLLQNQNHTGGSIVFSLGGNATTTPEVAPVERWKIEHLGSLCSNGNTSSTGLTNAGATFNIQNNNFEGLALVKNGYGWGTPLFIQLLNASGTRNILEIQYNAGSSGTGSAIGGISATSSSTSFNTSSDYRLKENVVNISDGITRLKTLKPYRFNFKVDTSTTVDGFFAHEVTAVPEAVTGTKDEVEPEDNDMRGVKKGDPIYQSIDQSKLVPLLVAALQEAVAKIETLETKVAALEAG